MKKFLSKKINSKGAASILMVMSVLAAVFAISFGSILVAIIEKNISLNKSDSIKAYYGAETGIEKAIYDIIKGDGIQSIEPAIGFRCEGTCNIDNEGCCTEAWSPEGYCLSITETEPCDVTTITSVKSIGRYRTTQRSIEIAF